MRIEDFQVEVEASLVEAPAVQLMFLSEHPKTDPYIKAFLTEVAKKNHFEPPAPCADPSPGSWDYHLTRLLRRLFESAVEPGQEELPDHFIPSLDAFKDCIVCLSDGDIAEKWLRIWDKLFLIKSDKNLFQFFYMISSYLHLHFTYLFEKEFLVSQLHRCLGQCWNLLEACSIQDSTQITKMIKIFQKTLSELWYATPVYKKLLSLIREILETKDKATCISPAIISLSELGFSEMSFFSRTTQEISVKVLSTINFAYDMRVEKAKFINQWLARCVEKKVDFQSVCISLRSIGRHDIRTPCATLFEIFFMMVSDKHWFPLLSEYLFKSNKTPENIILIYHLYMHFPRTFRTEMPDAQKVKDLPNSIDASLKMLDENQRQMLTQIPLPTEWRAGPFTREDESYLWLLVDFAVGLVIDYKNFNAKKIKKCLAHLQVFFKVEASLFFLNRSFSVQYIQWFISMDKREFNTVIHTTDLDAFVKMALNYTVLKPKKEPETRVVIRLLYRFLVPFFSSTAPLSSPLSDDQFNVLMFYLFGLASKLASKPDHPQEALLKAIDTLMRAFIQTQNSNPTYLNATLLSWAFSATDDPMAFEKKAARVCKMNRALNNLKTNSALSYWLKYTVQDPWLPSGVVLLCRQPMEYAKWLQTMPQHAPDLAPILGIVFEWSAASWRREKRSCFDVHYLNCMFVRLQHVLNDKTLSFENCRLKMKCLVALLQTLNQLQTTEEFYDDRLFRSFDACNSKASCLAFRDALVSALRERINPMTLFDSEGARALVRARNEQTGSEIGNPVNEEAVKALVNEGTEKLVTAGSSSCPDSERLPNSMDVEGLESESDRLAASGTKRPLAFFSPKSVFEDAGKALSSEQKRSRGF